MTNIRDYVQHKPDCARRDKQWNIYPCSCGLDEALRRVEELHVELEKWRSAAVAEGFDSPLRLRYQREEAMQMRDEALRQEGGLTETDRAAIAIALDELVSYVGVVGDEGGLDDEEMPTGKLRWAIRKLERLSGAGKQDA